MEPVSSFRITNTDITQAITSLRLLYHWGYYIIATILYIFYRYTLLELKSDRWPYVLIIRMEVVPSLVGDNGFGFKDMNRSYPNNQGKNCKFNSGLWKVSTVIWMITPHGWLFSMAKSCCLVIRLGDFLVMRHCLICNELITLKM